MYEKNSISSVIINPIAAITLGGSEHFIIINASGLKAEYENTVRTK